MIRLGAFMMAIAAISTATMAQAQPSGADEATLASVRQIVEITAGQGPGGADEVIYGRGSGAQVTITGIGIAQAGEGIEPQADVDFVIRVRATTTAAPLPADLALVRTTGTPLYVGAERGNRRLWEIRREGDAVFYRDVASAGRPSSWQQAPAP